MRLLLCLPIILVILTACLSEEDKSLRYALDIADENRYELEKVLDYYKDDSLKQEAARCAWQKPWAKSVSFSDFCRYVLPYRSLYEIPGSIRKHIMNEYLPVLDSLQVKTPLEAGTVIQQMMREKYKFIKIDPLLYPSVDNVYMYGYARCDGFVLTSVFIMRALGIPASVEHTIWSKRNGDHYWCTILSEGHSYPYTPENEAPGKLVKNLTVHYLTPPKVYQYEFAPVKEQLPDWVNDGYRCFLKNPLLKDVTCEYMAPITDIAVSATFKEDKTNSPVYLCIYNNKHWRLLAMGKREGDKCLFKDVVKDDVFIVADSPDGNTLRYITNPFYVDKEGGISLLGIDTTEKDVLIVENSIDYTKIPETLQIWDNTIKGFHNFAFTVDSVSNKPYCSYEVPRNSLFRATVAADSKFGGERVFFVENNKIRLY